MTKNWFQTHPRLDLWRTCPSFPPLCLCRCSDIWPTSTKSRQNLFKPAPPKFPRQAFQTSGMFGCRSTISQTVGSGIKKAHPGRRVRNELNISKKSVHSLDSRVSGMLQPHEWWGPLLNYGSSVQIPAGETWVGGVNDTRFTGLRLRWLLARLLTPVSWSGSQQDRERYSRCV